MTGMRWLGLGLALALGGGIVAYAVDRPSPDGASGIRGIVLAGPTCPGPIPAPPAPLPPGAPPGRPLRTACPDRPVSLPLEIVEGGGRVVAGVTSADDGRFTVAVGAGTYTIRSAAKGLPALRPQSVTVPSATWVDVELRADTGIR